MEYTNKAFERAEDFRKIRDFKKIQGYLETLKEEKWREAAKHADEIVLPGPFDERLSTETHNQISYVIGALREAVELDGLAGTAYDEAWELETLHEADELEEGDNDG